MTTQVIIYPNPFIASLSFEVTVERNVSAIVQMLNQDLKIIRMLSWHLKKGINKTTIEDLDSIPAGTYYIDIKNAAGNNLSTTKLAKLVETHEL